MIVFAVKFQKRMRSLWAMVRVAQARTSADANSLFICNPIEP
ncbi:MAG: hypothetical protein K0Q60_4327, partial [Microvirga sp.]|nr:hypothetical protein [Microvirga sp.]